MQWTSLPARPLTPQRLNTPGELQPPQQLVIRCMRPNPKPDHLIRLAYAYGTVSPTHPHGVNRPGGMHTFPAETRMPGVLPEEHVGVPRLLLHLGRQLPEHGTKRRGNMGDHSRSGSSTCVFPARCSASAWSANWARRSAESAKAWSHRRSDASSSRMTAARASCSCSGSFEASANASSRSFVICAPRRCEGHSD